LDQLKKKMEMQEGRCRICQTYLDSEEIETQDEDMLTVLGWMVKTIRSLPECFNVLDFTGRKQTIQIIREEFWSELMRLAESERLYEQLHSFAALANLLKYASSYLNGKRPIKALMSASSLSTGKTDREAEGIYTLCTTATRTTEAAVVPSSKDCHSLYNLLRAQFTPQISNLTT
jgi:hypothetical protein